MAQLVVGQRFRLAVGESAPARRLRCNERLCVETAENDLSQATVWQVEPGKVPGTVKLRNSAGGASGSMSVRYVGVTQFHQIAVLRSADMYSDLMATVGGDREISFYFAVNGDPLAFSEQGQPESPSALPHSNPTVFVVETLGDQSPAASASPVAPRSAAGSPLLAASPTPAFSEPVSQEQLLPLALRSLPVNTKQEIICLAQSSSPMWRPVTVVVKNDVPTATVTLYSFTLIKGVLSQGSPDPTTAPSATTGNAIFWQCLEKGFVGAKGEAVFEVRGDFYGCLHFHVRFNHPYGIAHSRYEATVDAPQVGTAAKVCLTMCGDPNGKTQLIGFVVQVEQ
eukprot:TRINITY_DN3602_c0_g1_i2.p1 TRINITY_DN3602_c0_g1~~TRINITY_DN3602_c0_g1_i2.p1  ORF type:complete len:346 (-),score=57.73 TRINITY_DN3602_c0_g1_i2:25-1041(-)